MRLTQLLMSPLRDISLILALLPVISAVTFQPAPSPNLDLSQLGQVALAGDFQSLSLYRYVGQNQNGLSANGSQSLLGRYPTGEFANLQASDASINAMCPFMMQSGAMAGVIVGGNFTSLGGAPAAAVALFNPDTQEITPLPGLTGQVKTVFCDNERQTVYFGGMFSGGNSTNAIAWTTGWTNLPISGFNGPVNTITKLPNGHIAFGGAFTSTGQLMAPTTPDAQVVNVGSATISAGPPAANAQYRDASNVLCQTSTQGGPGQAWLTADNGGGFWRADFGFSFTPSKLRLRQSTVEGYDTQTWRFTAFPLNGILNFTYTDPSTGVLQSCTNQCPLPQGNSSYQDFAFVNPIEMTAFQIDITGFVGKGAGLGGVQLFQNDIFAFAVNDFNEPKCDGVSTTGSSSNVVGRWNQIPAGQQSKSGYLSRSLSNGSEGSDASVVFRPDIRESGNYTINIHTPGCVGDGTCGTRGMVNVTGIMATGTSSGPQTFQTLVSQTNNNEKYDPIYFGYVDATTDNFKPSITLTPAAGQQGPLTIVANRVQFAQTSSTGGTLNGLFDYDPNSGSVQGQDLSTNAVDSAGSQLDDGAVVHSIVVVGSTTYVAGRFSDSGSGIHNILSIGDGNSTGLPNGGLDDAITTLYSDSGNQLYIGGNFTNTYDRSVNGLNNVAIFSTSDNTWKALGAGVNGQVSSIVPVNITISGSVTTGIAVSGSFSQINAFAENATAPASNIAVWIPSSNNWLQNLSGGQVALSGTITARTDIPGSDPLFAGNVDSQTLLAPGAVDLNSGDDGLSLAQLPIQIRPTATNSSSSLSKRAATEDAVDGVYTGLFYNQDGTSATILGGHFEADATNGSTVSNLALIYTSDSNAVTGIVANMSASQAVTTLANSGSTLFVGGTIPSGMLTYDIVKRDLSDIQPPALSGDDLTVNAIALRPNSAEVYVGGTFSSAGSLPCNGLCIWDTGAQQWHTVNGGTFSGVNTVNELIWSSADSLIIAGNLTVDNQHATMAYYDAKVQQFTLFAGSNDTANVPGPITAISAIDNGYKSFFISGIATSNSSAFITKYVPNDGNHFDQGGSWTSILSTPETLGSSSRIDGLQVLALTEPHASSPLIPDGQTLLVTGALQLENFGNSSAALFNGTDFTPFVFSAGAGSTPGSVRKAFVANPQNLLNSHGGYLALGFIVLIGLAIALGCVFLLVVAGILAEKIRRRREGYIPAPTYNYATEKAGPKRGNVGGISPERLFGGVGGSPERHI